MFLLHTGSGRKTSPDMRHLSRLVRSGNIADANPDKIVNEINGSIPIRAANAIA
jgi:hypothetical protein